MNATLTSEHSTEFEIPRRPSLRTGLKWSFIAHVLFILMVTLNSLVFPSKSVPYIPTLKVDLVGLPDVLKKDQARADHSKQFTQEIEQVLKRAEENSKQVQIEQEAHRAAQEKTHAEKARSDEMVLKSKPLVQDLSQSDHHPKNVEKRNKRALDRLRAFSKVQEVQEPEDENAPEAKSIPTKGNKLSAGSSVSDEAQESDQANYYDQIRDRIQDNWSLPTWLSRQTLTAQVRILIDSKGNLYGMKFTKSSENTQFDDAVKRAIQSSLPFPAPPDDLQSSLLTDGISLGFPL